MEVKVDKSFELGVQWGGGGNFAEPALASSLADSQAAPPSPMASSMASNRIRPSCQQASPLASSSRVLRSGMCSQYWRCT